MTVSLDETDPASKSPKVCTFIHLISLIKTDFALSIQKRGVLFDIAYFMYRMQNIFQGHCSHPLLPNGIYVPVILCNDDVCIPT